MTIATLGLAVHSGQVSAATPELLKMANAAGQAEAAARRLAGASDIEAAAQGKATAASRMHEAALRAEAVAMRMAGAQRTNLIFQLNDIGVSLASGMNPLMVAIQQGSQIATIYGAGQGGIGRALQETGNIAMGLATKFWPVAAAVGAVTAGLAGLTHTFNETATTQLSMLDVMQAGWEMFAQSVTSLVAPVFGAIGSWLADGWDAAAPVLKAAGNALIGTFVGAFDAVKAAWGVLPGALGDVAYSAANSVLDGIEWMISKARDGINALIAMANQVPGVAIDSLGNDAINLNVDNPYAGAMAGAGAGVLAALRNGLSQDYLGGLGDAWSTRAQQIARARAEAEALEGAAGSANNAVTRLLDQGLGDLMHWTQQFGDAAYGAFQNLGTGIIDVFKKGGDIAQNVLSMLMDKVGQFGETLLNNGLNGLLGMGLNMLGGMFGGGTWGVAGGFMAGTGMPGIFGIPGMADGGTVGKPGLSWVGESGPELLRLPTGAQIIPNGPAVAMAANSNAVPALNITINIDAKGATADAAPEIARQVTAALKSQIPDMIRDYNKNPYRRA